MHGDGCPFAKGQSAEILSWNFMSLPALERVLFCLIEKSWLCCCGCKGKCTFDALLEIMVWSLQCLFSACWPTCRHDKTPWSAEDKKCGRDKNNGRFGFAACLQQVRGDWAWYKELFQFKGWASTEMCWRCMATQPGGPDKRDYTNFRSNAPWRATMHTMTSFFTQMRRNNIRPSVLFSAPGFLWTMIMIDPLHCLDLGVSQLFLGNLFYAFRYSKLAKGSNME